MEKSRTFQRLYGCMIGGAVGDAMGFPTEGMSYKGIRRKFGKVTGPMVREGAENLHPPVLTTVYTDDTVMKHMVCEAIFRSEGQVKIEKVADVWRETITDLNEWVWWCNTRVVAEKLHMASWIPLREIGRDSIACNDAAMIIGPVGLVNGGDPQTAAEQAWDISALWQNSYSRECCASMAAAHAHAITKDATIDSIIETARAYSPTMAPYIDTAMEYVSRYPDIDEFTEQYYANCLHFPNQDYWTPDPVGNPDWCFGADPLEVCTEALAFFKLANGSAKEAILGAINFGRDCDTISGIASAFCGALNGPETVPTEWVDQIVAANPKPDIKELSEKLYKLLQANIKSAKERLSEQIDQVE